MRLPAPLPDGCAMQMRYLQSSLQCCNRSLLQVPQSSSYLVPTFLFLSLPTLLQRLQFQYTQCQQSHMISKEMPAKSQSLKREIRFVCSAFLHCGQWLIGMCNRTEYRKYTQICGEHNPKHEWYFRICFHVP